MYDHIAPPLPPPVPLMLPTLGPSQVMSSLCSFLLITPEPGYRCSYVYRFGTIHSGVCNLPTTMSPKEKDSLSLSNHSLIIVPLPRVGPLPHLHWNCDRFHLVQVASVCVSWCVQLPWHVQKSTSSSSPPALPTRVLSVHASPTLPSLGWERLIEMAWPQLASTVSTYPYLWLDISLGSNCSPRWKEPLWPKLRAVQTCGYNQKYLVGSWTAWLFNMTTAVGLLQP